MIQSTPYSPDEKTRSLTVANLKAMEQRPVAGRPSFRPPQGRPPISYSVRDKFELALGLAPTTGPRCGRRQGTC